jgi:hypothetical protein
MRLDDVTKGRSRLSDQEKTGVDRVVTLLSRAPYASKILRASSSFWS